MPVITSRISQRMFMMKDVRSMERVRDEWLLSPPSSCTASDEEAESICPDIRLLSSMSHISCYFFSADVGELKQMVGELQYAISHTSARLIRQLKRKDRHMARLHRNCDVVTAVLQAASLKRRKSR